MVLALWWRVPTTLYLDDTGCRLSQWRYWSVCVGFLYTVVCSLPSWSGFIRMSRKGKAPSGPGSSTVNWMFLSTEFRCRKNSSCGTSLWWQRCHQQTFSTIKGVWWWLYGSDLKLLHVEVCHNWADGWAHGSPLYLLIELPLEVKYVLLRHNPRRSMICCMDKVVLLWRLWSSLRSFSMIFNVGSMGTEVKSALTSKDIMTSSEASWMLFRSCRKSWMLCMWCLDLPTRGLRIFGSSLAVW